MRVLFFGTSGFAVRILQALVDADIEVIGAVSQPDKPTGRGMTVRSAPVKLLADKLSLPAYTPDKARSPEFVTLVESLQPDVFVVAAYGQILSQRLLDIPPHGGINVHASLLPHYRGAAPIQRAILEGEKATGITIMQMDKGMDTGDIRLIHETPIDDQDTAGTLETKLAELGAQMIIEALRLLAQGALPRTPQDDEQATYAAMITKNEGELDWREPAERIRNRIRAFAPRPGAFARLSGRVIRILRAEVADGSGPPGQVVAIRPGLVVACGHGALRLVDVQPEGRPPMQGSDFANGARLKPGASFDLRHENE